MVTTPTYTQGNTRNGVPIPDRISNASGTASYSYDSPKAQSVVNTPTVNTAQPNPKTVNATPFTNPPTNQNSPAYTGGSIVDALNQAGQPSDFASRAKLAGTQGIQNYTGTADQNTQLVQKYKQGLSNLKATGLPPADTGGQAGTAIKGAMPETPEVLIQLWLMEFFLLIKPMLNILKILQIHKVC